MKIKVGTTFKDIDDHAKQSKKILIEKTLEHTNGNRTKAAAILGLQYNGLNTAMKKFKMKSLMPEETKDLIRESLEATRKDKEFLI